MPLMFTDIVPLKVVEKAELPDGNVRIVVTDGFGAWYEEHAPDNKLIACSEIFPNAEAAKAAIKRRTVPANKQGVLR